MADLPPPVLLAVIPCDILYREPYTGRYSAIGIINWIRGDSGFPIMVDKIAVYAAVTEVARPTRIAVRLTTPNGDVVAAGPEWDLPGGSPLFVHELGCALGGVTLGAAGYYSIRVTANGDMLGEWRFQVGVPKGVS